MFNQWQCINKYVVWVRVGLFAQFFLRCHCQLGLYACCLLMFTVSGLESARSRSAGWCFGWTAGCKVDTTAPTWTNSQLLALPKRKRYWLRRLPNRVLAGLAEQASDFTGCTAEDEKSQGCCTQSLWRETHYCGGLLMCVGYHIQNMLKPRELSSIIINTRPIYIQV